VAVGESRTSVVPETSMAAYLGIVALLEALMEQRSTLFPHPLWET
jgi:hypothetical protein